MYYLFSYLLIYDLLTTYLLTYLLSIFLLTYIWLTYLLTYLLSIYLLTYIWLNSYYLSVTNGACFWDNNACFFLFCYGIISKRWSFENYSKVVFDFVEKLFVVPFIKKIFEKLLRESFKILRSTMHCNFDHAAHQVL